MAKELPYFKFEPAEYLTKDISFCSLSAQGLFINICAYYWQRGCRLQKKQLTRRFPNKNEFEELIEEGCVDLEGENIRIKFLDVQYEEITAKSNKNSANGSKGGAPKGNNNANKNNPKTTQKQPKNNPKTTQKQGIREDKIREDENKREGSLETPSAFGFLLNQNSLNVETWMMQNKSSVENWDKMIMDFNDTADQEQLDYDLKVLFPRLKKYCRNWISNQHKFKAKNNDYGYGQKIVGTKLTGVL